MNTATQHSLLRAPGTTRPSMNSPTAVLSHGVGESPIEATGLSDEERTAAIARARAAMDKHTATYEATGCFAAKGDADRAARLWVLLCATTTTEKA